MKTLRFGIEIETVGLSRQALAQAIHSGVGGTLSSFDTSVRDPQGRTWSVVHDGSLSGGSHRSGEIVSPVLTYDDLPVLQEVVRGCDARGRGSTRAAGSMSTSTARASTSRRS